MPSEPKGGKKKKKKAANEGGGVQSTARTEVEPTVVAFPAVVPGGFVDEPQQQASEMAISSTTASKSKKKKKAKKNAGNTSGVPLDAQSDSSATAPESSTPVPRPPAKRKSTPVLDADGPWTRVESRKRPTPQQQPAPGSSGAPEPAASDAGITTSVTGTSSPVTERTEDEQALATEENRRTLAERLLPKPRKTHVEECVHISRAGFSPDAIVVCWKHRMYLQSHALCACSRVQMSGPPQDSHGPTTRMSMTQESRRMMPTARTKAGGLLRVLVHVPVCTFS